MKKEEITETQLLALIFNFLLGTAIVLGVGLEARQDAWLVILFATVIGIGFMYFYYTLNHFLPDKNLFEIMEYCFTRPIAIFVSFGYITYFLYIASRLVREFAELITTVILVITPIGIITLSMMFVIAYILYLGLEVFARVAEIFTPYLIGFFLLLLIFTVASGDVDTHNILPVLGDGLKPVITALTSLISFPFGELLTFTVILSSVSQFKKSKKVSMIGVALAGSFLLMGSFIIVSTLGVQRMEYKVFPLLSATRDISIGDFIERVDAFVVFIMMLGILVKGSVYYYGAIKGLEYIFRIPYRYFAVPIAMIISVFSQFIASNYVEHLEEGRMITPPLHIPMQFVIPVVMMIILIWKMKIHKSKKMG